MSAPTPSMAQYIPTISASSVAAIIGLNRYKPIPQAMYEVLLKDKTTKEKIYQIERAHNRRSILSMKNMILADPTVKDVVSTSLASCNGLTDLEPVLAQADVTASAILALKFQHMPAAVQSILRDEVRGQIARQRGTANENTILDKYEEDNNVEVVERNTKMLKKTYSNFVLSGRTDGYVASLNRIVDSKDRVRFISQPPIYDEVQMRVYMDMGNIPEAELIERFPDAPTRTTVFNNDPVKWQAIEASLSYAANILQNAVANEEELKRIVFANTVQV
jgi:hypothetical protein